MALIDIVIGLAALFIVVGTIFLQIKKQRSAKKAGKSVVCSSCDVGSCSVASCCSLPEKKTSSPKV